MAGLVLRRRPHVENNHLSVLCEPPQSWPVYQLQAFADGQRSHELADLRQAQLAKLAQGRPQPPNGRVSKRVVHVRPVPARIDEAGGTKDLEVLTGVWDSEVRLARQYLDRPLALPEQVEELQAFRRRERMPDAGELFVEAVLEGPVVHQCFIS